MRTSYQVGRPWMLEGKMLRGATGMPMRSTEGEQFVGTGGTGAVDVGKPDDEIVYALDWHARSASVILIRYFCMSQAPVGQRSAHSPQCRHTSSSLTMTRPVLRLLPI